LKQRIPQNNGPSNSLSINFRQQLGWITFLDSTTSHFLKLSSSIRHFEHNIDVCPICDLYEENDDNYVHGNFLVESEPIRIGGKWLHLKTKKKPALERTLTTPKCSRSNSSKFLSHMSFWIKSSDLHQINSLIIIQIHEFGSQLNPNDGVLSRIILLYWR